jgi:MipA family protein
MTIRPAAWHLSRLVGLTAVALSAAACSATAQSIPMPSMPDGIRVTVGAQAVTAPRFEGSKTMEFSALPVFGFAPAGGGGGGPSFDPRALDDISVSIAKFGGFEVGPLAGYRSGRSESASPRLRGLGDVDGGIVAGGFAKYNFGPNVYVRGSYHQAISGDDTGGIFRLALGAGYDVTGKLYVKAIATMDFADHDYMQTFFGVTPQQSARSALGLRAYDAGSGPKSAGILLSTEYELVKDWKLLAAAGYSRLLGDAAHSPVVESADRYEARLGLSHSFVWRMK